MKKIKCLITAGPTREYFDPVRFISNPSSGKMGWNIANATKQKGWDTTLVLGPSQLSDIDGVNIERVTSADDMLKACEKYFDDCDILIMSAAVSDVRPKSKIEHKAKKDEIELSPQLERTPDILLTLSKKKDDKILIGFAAETKDIIAYAKDKLERKNLDAIVANSVASSSYGFASDNNKINVILRNGKIINFPQASKKELSEKLVDFLCSQFFK